MSKRYADELTAEGIKRVSVITPGVDLNLFRPSLRVGVIGRTYHTGRKGEALVADVMDVPGIEWRFTGSGWPGPSQFIADGKMADFYNDLDYVLVPARYEGGPMCVLEALACGKPIIASDVGWVNEYPHIPFENENSDSLRQVLKNLVQEREVLRSSVEHRTWAAWGEQHLKLFQKVAEEFDLSGAGPSRGGAVAQQRDKFALVTHGSEKTTRGGPTLRVAKICATAKDNGLDVTNIHRSDPDSLSEGFAAVHVFNSWPLQTAIESLVEARSTGSAVAYSPIALNLNYLKYYQESVPELLSRARSEEQVMQGLENIRRQTPKWDPASKSPPIQGVDRHFESLIHSTDLADHLICLSRYERSFLEAIGCDVSKSTIIRNGVDTETMAGGDAQKFIAATGLRDFVLFVGRIEPRKNQAIAAFALRHLDIPFVCIGHIGDPDYFELVKKWAGPKFVHIDRIDDRELLAGAMKAATCMVLNSWAEGAPLAALEAAAAGTPLILSNMSGENEYLEEYASYVHPCDVDSLRETVETLMAQSAQEQLRPERTQHARPNFSIDRHTDETVALYEKLRSIKTNQVEPTDEDSQFVLDVSHLAHHLYNFSNLTGVTAVEFSLISAMRAQVANIPTILWNSPNRRFVFSPTDDVMSDELISLSNAREISGPSSGIMKVSNVQLHSENWTDGMEGSAEFGPGTGLKRRSITAVKHSLNTLPGPLKDSIVSGIQRIRPEFNSFVPEEHHFIQKSSEGTASAELDSAVNLRTQLQPVVQQKNLSSIMGNRLLLLGQPWISNDRYLSDLESFVRSNRLRLWAHIPDILYVTDANSFDERTRANYARRLRKLLEFADTAIVISDEARNEIDQFCRDKGVRVDTHRIHLGPNEQLLQAEPKAPSAGLPENFVMFVSSMNNRKRHDFIVDLWREVNAELSRNSSYDPATLLLVGSPQSGFEKFKDESYLNSLRKDRIQVLSNIGASELSWLYSNCLFTVYPARREGWGMPPIESLSFGKPCLVSDTVPAAIETDCAGLIKLAPFDYFGWKRQLKTLLTNEAVRDGFSKHARNYSAVGWQISADGLLNLHADAK
ncbi:MAG: glycosyltransferase [Pseudomonadota bacterium]